MMCPYCGEEVPVDSNRCWKCGTDLPEGASRAPGDELEVPDDDDGPPGATASAGGDLVTCPHCDAPVPKKAQRCRECGRPVREVKGSSGAGAWRLGAWLVVLVLAVGAAFLVVTFSLKSFRKGTTRLPKSDVTWEKLHGQMTAPGTDETRRKEIWDRLYDSHFVRWSGYVASHDPGSNEVTFSQKKGGKPECVVEFEDLSELKDGGDEVVWYSARLVDFQKGAGKEGGVFRLK